MPNSEKIELLISPEALKQFEQLKSASDANTASFEKLIAKAVELNKAVGNASTFKEINKATQEMTDNEKALAKQVDDLAKANAKLQALYSDEAKKIAEIKVQQQEQNKVLKEQAKEALGLVGAYDKLTKEYNEAAKAAKDLAAQFGAESKQAKEASARALELDARLKAADANVGRFNKNVGNYSGALNTLQKALQDVSKKIDDNTKSGQQNTAVVEALQKEQGLLQSLIDTQSKGFANATGEIRNNQQAILLLSQVYGEDSAVVTELTAKTAHLADTVSDMKATIKAQASDTHVFDGLIGAAQGLVGVYSIAQGAAALFGDENKDLQETFIKLQAVMTVLQGLQGIQNVLQKESAARQLINIGLQRAAVIQTSIQAATESKNIIVRYAAIVAQKALNFAMSSAGGPLLAVIGLIALMVLSLKTFAAETGNASRAMEHLNDQFEINSKLLEEDVDATKQVTDKAIAEMEFRNSSESSIRVRIFQGMQEELAKRKAFNDKNSYLYDEADRTIRAFIKKGAARLDLHGNVLKEGKKLSDEEQATLENAIKVRDQYNENQQKQFDLERSIDITRLHFLKQTNDDIAKVDQNDIEVRKASLQTRLQLQQSIAGNERKTQAERIAALQEAANLQRQLINADANSKRLTPGLSSSQIGVIEAQRNASLIQSRRESNKAVEDLNRSYAERERKARFDIIRTEIEDQIKADDLILQNEKSGFDKRLDALYDGYQKRRDIIIAQHDLDIQNDTLTAEERIAIEKKYASDINGLTIDYGLQQQALYKDNQDKINEIIEKGQQGRLDKISTGQANELIELDKQFRAGKISVEEYGRQRTDIEQKYAIISLKQEVDNATAKVLATKEGTAERFAAEKELAEKTLALNDEVNAKQLAAAQKLADARKELVSETFDTISSIQGSFFTRESDSIQRQLDQIDAQKQKDIDAANASIGTAQDKANAVAKIEARAQQKREDLERRQRQIELERARFEKAANIAQIIASTAAAVIEALKTYKGTPQAFAVAATIGTIGALNLAKAIATPLPKFAEGTEDAPGGLSLVGDGYKKELVITPQGQVVQTPSVPTVMNVPKHSIVFPDVRAALESGLAVNRHGHLVQQDGGSKEIKEVGRKIETLTKVMRNKPVLNMNADQGGLTAIWKFGANWVTYSDDQTRF
jgi:hypothetical protein